METQSVKSSPAVHRWTRAQYERMIEAGVLGEEDRVELIEGEIVSMSPQGSRHAGTVSLVEEALRTAFPEEVLIRIQMPLALGSASEPEPDIAVVEGRPRDFMETHPTTALLVVEVAETSIRFDRTRKQSLYAQHEIKEYWLVDLGAEHLEVYRHPSESQYEEKTTLHRGETVMPPEGKKPIAVTDLLP